MVSAMKRAVRRPVGLHPLIAAGILRQAKEQRAAEIARPMRELFRQLKTGEVFEVDGKAVMAMPELDESLRQSATDLVEIAPAILGWVDCWSRLAPRLRQDKLRCLADLLDRGKTVTPRLVELASDQFESAVRMIPAMEDGAIKSAVLTTQVAWEFEKFNNKEI